MPRITKAESLIPAIYRRNHLQTSMFAFVQGVKSTLHTVTTRDAIVTYMEVFGISSNDYSIDSALVIYNRMEKELLLIKKS